ncbi:tyrosine-type recombinase/integrase [Roseibium album]|uniref:tyrosine-type recombinase/integrase n=1 Tax=Roseibium album TaxID=311410 RepID=UPI003299E300
MPRAKLPPRLKLRKDGNKSVWVIKDGTRDTRTGCVDADIGGAEKRLQEYLTAKYNPPVSDDPRDITCADILNYYAQNKVPQIANRRNEVYVIANLATFWGFLTLHDVDKSNCRAYAAQRLSKGVTGGTVRRELETLRAAVNYYLEAKKIAYRPSFELPEKGDPRTRWLSRKEAAGFIRAARRRGNSHIARIILIGLYTGTRVGAIRKMKWVASIDSGYFDLENGIMYRKGHQERSTKKRRPTVHIPTRLLPHLRRWRAMDQSCIHVIHRDGTALQSVRKAWANSRKDAELGQEVVPHSLRHTAASWGIQNVRTTQELQALANFLGMSLKMLLEVYGHLNPVHQQSASDAISRRPGAP